MKRLMAIGAPLLALAIIGAITGGLVFGAFGGGGSGAVAASATQQDIFSALSSAQDSTPASEKPWLGARVVQTPAGPAVEAVIADSPADKAGLKRNDVIKAVDGTQVSDMGALLQALKDKKPGDTVTLSITRDGNAQDISVTLEARPEPLPRDHPLLPELNGIPQDQLFAHITGGSFKFSDSSGASHTATIDLGTVSAVDTTAKTVSVDLNAGSHQTYTITDSVNTFPTDLSKFQSGDKVIVLSVDGDLRAISKGGGHFLPFFGEHGGLFGKEGHGGHHGKGGGFEMMPGNGGGSGF